MALIKAKERVKRDSQPAGVRVLAQSQPNAAALPAKHSETTLSEAPPAFRPAWALGRVKAKVKSRAAAVPAPLKPQQARKPYPAHQHRVQAQATLTAHVKDQHFAEEREKMESVENLGAVADDVEAEATIFEWRARQQKTQSQSPLWYITFAVGVTAVAGILAFLGNYLGAVAVAFVGALIYVVSQRSPGEVRYRLMVDGVAIGDRLYQYRNLEAFNIVYEPGEVKTVIIRSKKMFSPLIQMEIGAANPVEIRDVLLEFLKEDLDIQEPLTDTWARRLGY